jgi:segregation and condensation protein B
MDYFGINSTDDLPKIKEVLADQIVEATVIKPEDFTDNSVFEQVSEEAAAEREEREEEEEVANATDKGDDLPGDDLPGDDLSGDDQEDA